MRIDKRYKKLLWFVLIEVIFIALSYFLFAPEISTGRLPYRSDLIFHWQRVCALTKGIGHLEPSFQFNYFMPYFGGATFTMYPWLDAMLLFVLKSFGLSPVASIYAYVCLITFLGFNIAYFASRTVLHHKYRPFAFALFYVIAPLVQGKFLPTTDFAVYLAIMLMPICFFGWIRCLDGGKNLMFSFGAIVLIFTHLLAAVILLGSLFCMTLYLISWTPVKNIKRLGKSLLTAIVITTFIWLPILVLTFTNKITMPVTHSLKKTAFLLPLNPQDILSGSTYLYTAFGIVAFILCLYSWKHMSAMTRSIFVMATILILFNLQFLPWSLLQKTPLHILQFPYRTAPIAHLFMTYLGVVYISQVSAKKMSNQMKASACGLLLIPAVALIMLPSFAFKDSAQGSRLLSSDNTLVFHKKTKAPQWLSFTINNHDLSSPLFMSYPIHTDYVPAKVARENGRLYHVNSSKMNDNYRMYYDRVHTNNGTLAVKEAHAKNNVKVPACIYKAQSYEFYNDGHKVSWKNDHGILRIKHLHRGWNHITFHTPVMWYRWVAYLVSFLGILSILIPVFRKDEQYDE